MKILRITWHSGVLAVVLHLGAPTDARGITISQPACAYSASLPPVQTVAASGRAASTVSIIGYVGPAMLPGFPVCPGVPAAADVPWIQISLPLGGPRLGYPHFTYTVDANSTETSRIGRITVDTNTYEIRQAGLVSQSPSGFVDTPANGATGLTGSVAVTGWAVDDLEVVAVRIYRDPVAGEGLGAIYIGDAVQVSGARPDIAAQYPGYLFRDRAGWGYLLLTNVLPHQGNGTFTLRVYAEDREGKQTLLGAPTVTCTNASATTPFGAIDTPGQGATVSGTAYVNFGWALTPNPKSIPADGSTIKLFIDGVDAGAVSYNYARPDIQALFPGYANTDGAIGVRTIDTTTLSDGVHTMAWLVTDNQGAASGIGSRFFTVANNTAGVLASTPAAAAVAARPSLNMPLSLRPVRARIGWALDAEPLLVAATREGLHEIVAPMMSLLELQLGSVDGAHYTGAQLVNGERRPLPIGSSLDAKTGVFRWQPGVAFVGRYELEFVRDDSPPERLRVAISLQPGRITREVALVIDTPSAEADGPFLVAGWALDPQATRGTGIDAVHVWAYPRHGGVPIFLGAATLDGERPDVAAIYGPQFGRAGFGVMVSGLARGAYDLAVFPRRRGAREFDNARTVRVVVR